MASQALFVAFLHLAIPLANAQYPSVAEPVAYPAADQSMPPPSLGVGPHSVPSAPNYHSGGAGRHLGLGDPLVGTSWLNRPFYAGWMVGGLWGDELIQGRIDQDEDIFGGYRVGWDFDPFWGVEARFASAHIDFKDQIDLTVDRTAEHQYWDIDFVYYPWGDSRWRPYASVGLGLLSIDLLDATGQDLGETLLTIPLGTGVKYYWKHWMALRRLTTPLRSRMSVKLRGGIERSLERDKDEKECKTRRLEKLTRVLTLGNL